MKQKKTMMGTRVGPFTLIELLIVISIIAILLALLLPSLKKAQRTAKGVQCLGNTRQISARLQMYFNDMNEGYPPLFYGNTYALSSKEDCMWMDLLGYKRTVQNGGSSWGWPAEKSFILGCPEVNLLPRINLYYSQRAVFNHYDICYGLNQSGSSTSGGYFSDSFTKMNTIKGPSSTAAIFCSWWSASDQYRSRGKYWTTNGPPDAALRHNRLGIAAYLDGHAMREDQKWLRLGSKDTFPWNRGNKGLPWSPGSTARVTDFSPY